MFYTKDHKTVDMFDQFAFLGEKRRRLLDNSWAKIFREEILHNLPVEKLGRVYHEIMGRPTKELYAMLGIMILQQMEDLTDEDAVQQFAFNIKWHYALNVTNVSDCHSYICTKTLWTMRSILCKLDLYTPLFENVTDALSKAFEVDSTKQRIDSTHIFSNMRHLGRIGLFVKTIKKFLVNLHRHHKELYSELEKEFLDRYMSKKGESAFSMVKPSESAKTLQELGKDLFFLTERFKDNADVAGMSSYQFIVRLLKEQCIVEEDVETHAKKVAVKPNKDVPSDSLQNPSDPDAGYSGHKGKGYQVQVMETYSPDKEKEQLSLITHIAVEPAHKSDAHALLPAIEDTSIRDLKPVEILADSLYGGDENCEQAKELGVEVISPIMGSIKETSLTLNEFTLSHEKEITACPKGIAPIQIKKKTDDVKIAVFSRETCSGCTVLCNCPVKAGKLNHYLRYDNKTLRMAQRRAREKTLEFKERYRFRSGIEATMSALARRTGIKRLRVRGLEAVSLAATLKVTGLNILRATAFKIREKRRQETQRQNEFGLLNTILVFKEQFLLATTNMGRIFPNLYTKNRFAAQFVA
jgi:hypothetical protein